MTDLEELVEIEKEISRLEARRNELIDIYGADPILAARLKTVFDEFENLQSLTWVQYIPYFNDGDPCVWTVMGPVPNSVHWNDEGWFEVDDDDGIGEYVDTWSFKYHMITNSHDDDEYHVTARRRYSPITVEEAPALFERLGDIEEWLDNNERLLNRAFGHAVVQVTRDGEVRHEEYQHD